MGGSGRAFAPVDLRQAAAVQPYFVYGRFPLNQPKTYTVYEIPYGFNFLLRRVISRWDAARVGVANGYVLPIELFNSSLSRARQNEPIPLSLGSSPGGENVSSVEVGAPLGISFLAESRTSARIVNVAFGYGDALRAVVTNPDFPGAAFVQFIDLVLEGYLIPENTLALWGA